MRTLKPEKQVQILEVEPWLRQHGFSYEIYDSKGAYSASLGRYVRNKGLKKGTPDIIGCDKNGIALFLELKEPKKGHVLRLEQYIFLRTKILSNAFAVCVSSSAQLEEYYLKWSNLESAKQEYLLSCLPDKVLIDSKPPKIVQAPTF